MTKRHKNFISYLRVSRGETIPMLLKIIFAIFMIAVGIGETDSMGNYAFIVWTVLFSSIAILSFLRVWFLYKRLNK